MSISDFKPVTKKNRDLPSQNKLLHQWLGTARWTYNKCVEAIKQKTAKANKKELRALCINKDAFGEGKQNQWVLETPYDIRDDAMIDVVKAVQSNLAAERSKFTLKFRSLRDESQSLTVHKKHWCHKRGGYSALFGVGKLRSPEVLPDTLECDSRLIRNRLGHWYLCLPMEVKTIAASENQTGDVCPDGDLPERKHKAVLSLDPGVRTFMTGYDPLGRVWEWGNQDMQRIYRLSHTVDKLQSRWTQKGVLHKKRYKLQRAARRLRLKVHNLVDEMHRKLAIWLCENYQVVLLPAFQTSQMIRRGQRKIRSRTVRGMVTWSHFRFRQRLLAKARAYPDCRIVICDEAYTSKTCGKCGQLHHKLGGNKIFKCPSCSVVIDRDVNGARNILLRFLTLNQSRTKIETCSSE